MDMMSSVGHQICSKIRSYLPATRQRMYLGVASLSALYIIFSVFGLSLLFALCLFTASMVGFVSLRWQVLRQQGIINKVSPKVRYTLLNRSIFDIYRDLVYFPLVTKIIGAFIKGAVTKPPPQELPCLFQQLPKGIRDAIHTKGLLHLTPARVEQLFLQKENIQEAHNQAVVSDIHKQRLHRQISEGWDNLEKYQGQPSVKVHERTLGKELLLNVNDRIKWKHIMGLATVVGYGLMKTRSKKMGKILLYNGSVTGIFLLLILVLIKAKRPNYSRQQQALTD